MNTFNKHHIDIDLHCIELTFQHMRICAPSTLKKLTSSVDESGQLVPVIVVPASAPNHFTLMDGYLRIQALKKLRQDTAKAEVWACSEEEALLSLLANHGQRKWEIIEEASALRELQIRYHLTHDQIAKKIGRTQSWISHRIAILETLSDKYIQSIVNGQISAWAAQRVLVPIARAMPAHADQLFEYLQSQTHSTRELSDYFKHYKKSNKRSRENMVMQPELFFKAQQSLSAERQAKLLKAGPEGQWRSRLANISDHIKHLERLAPQLFYDRQLDQAAQQLLEPLDRIQSDLNRITTTSRRKEDERQDDASNHYNTASIGEELSAH
ncbi:MAG: hypothetical protein A3F17_06235 [Gammaproteobacteria bacterium RIFCSPHIGHO2_12_FULL_41_15]|nr:MAG: hypothetical protein A3F17_06235 [Gammaproteobacteria bacterium RIFCSPHIGHO2_12_FULL_41_15]